MQKGMTKLNTSKSRNCAPYKNVRQGKGLKLVSRSPLQLHPQLSMMEMCHETQHFRQIYPQHEQHFNLPQPGPGPRPICQQIRQERSPRQDKHKYKHLHQQRGPRHICQQVRQERSPRQDEHKTHTQVLAPTTWSPTHMATRTKPPPTRRTHTPALALTMWSPTHMPTSTTRTNPPTRRTQTLAPTKWSPTQVQQGRSP